MSAVLDRTADQRMAALARANEIRTLRARVKRDVKARQIEAWPLVADPPVELATMHVYELVRALPAFGESRTSGLLRRLAISHSKTLGGLSSRQRGLLVAELRRLP